MRRSFVAVATLISVVACGGLSSPPRVAPAVDPFLETVERATFQWFWDTTNAANGLVPDRWPDINFSSIAAIGFGLTAYGVGAERGYVPRDQARDRTLTTLRFLLNAPQSREAREVTGYRGLFYHFLDMEKGRRYQTVELSTIDTALLMAGVLFAQSYFDREDPVEREIRDVAGKLYERVEWNWMQPRAPLIAMGWHPEKGMIAHDYKGYEEAMILYILAFGSPTYPISPDAWKVRTGNYKWDTFYGQQFVNYAPLFIHQYSHIWIDFRGIQDAYMREKGIDYFENSRRATYAQRAYAARNPNGFRDYGENVWGLTACIGPADAKVTVDGKLVQFHTYWARGASANDVRDDGTIAPTAAAGSLPFAPEIVIPALKAMHARYGERLFRRYGFVDAFNPTFAAAGLPPRRGTIHPGGWFVDDYLGIDQGPIVLMLENHRSGLVWNVIKKNPHIVRGLCRAGFTGGWLEGKCASPPPLAQAAGEQIVWTFDRLDAIGGVKTTVEGDPKIVDTPVGRAMEFDGEDDAVWIEKHPLAGAASFTWEAIFRPDGGATAQRWFHLAERDPASGRLTTADLDPSRDTNPRMLFEIRVADNNWYLDAFAAGPGYSRALMFKDKLHPVGRWYHVAQTFDGKMFRSYVNGVLQGEAEIAYTPQREGAASIGTRINRRNYFKGAVRLARFTRRALTPDQFLTVPTSAALPLATARSEQAAAR